MSYLSSATFHPLHYSTVPFLKDAGNKAVALRFALGLVLLWFLTRVSHLFYVYYNRRPRNVMLAGYPTYFGRLITALQGIANSPSVISDAYSKARGRAFAIPTLDTYHVFVSNPDQIRDLNNAPGRQLSFNEVLAGMVYPKYTLHGFSYDPEDPYSPWSVSALKSGLRPSLPSLQPVLQEMLEDSFAKEMNGKKDAGGWINISPSSVVQKVICDLNTYMILGNELSKDPLIVKASLEYAQDAGITSEILARIPSVLHPLVGNILMNWRGAKKSLVARLENLVQERISREEDGDVAEKKPGDLVQWFLDSPRKTPEMTTLGLIQRVLGFIFGAAYQMPMFIVFALYRLCKHPEYVQPLRDEIASMSAKNFYANTKKDMPLLDSFLRETARLHPLETGTAERKVMKPFTFSDGTHVPAGNYICIPAHALMLDPEIYPNPTEFDGFRFVNDANSESRFMQPSAIFPFWGSVGRPCPGRFYASMVVKMTVAHILKHYDFKLVDENIKPTFSLGVHILPSPWMKMLIRERGDDEE